MGQLELLACPVALHTWTELLDSKQVIHFVDNDSAAAGLVKGYSPQIDSTALIGEYWAQASYSKIDIYIDRVESKSNLADGPSRLLFQEMESLRAHRWSPAILNFSVSQIFPLFQE